MTEQEVINAIEDEMSKLFGRQPDGTSHDVPLPITDSLDLMEVEMVLNDRFDLSISLFQEGDGQWSIRQLKDKILPLLNEKNSG